MTDETFAPGVYAARRAALRGRLDGGVAVIPGARESPTNFAANPHPFVQDGSFAWFFGLGQADMIGLIDLDSGEDLLFGTDPDMESLVWNGPLPSLAERAASVGVTRTGSLAQAAGRLREARARGRAILHLPTYRADAALLLADLTGAAPAEIAAGASVPLVRAVVALREIKAPEEVAEIEAALAVSARMHLAAMAASRPGALEREVVAEMERLVRREGVRLAYPPIFSRRGEILHNPSHDGRLEAGDLVVNDSGASSAKGYASDVTRTLPVGGRFSARQRELYDIVLAAQAAAMAAVKPGAPFAELHRLAMRTLVEGLAAHGVFKGDPDEAVASGAYAVVQQAGLGHQLGLDVHDMEGLGEDHVGYDDAFRRSELFGLNRLRLAKPLLPGMVVTIEPGLYFIPPLIESWAAERRFAHLIDYGRLRAFAGFGGIRIEDDLLVTGDGARVLGPPIPRGADEVEAAMAA